MKYADIEVGRTVIFVESTYQGKIVSRAKVVAKKEHGAYQYLWLERGDRLDALDLRMEMEIGRCQ